MPDNLGTVWITARFRKRTAAGEFLGGTVTFDAAQTLTDTVADEFFVPVDIVGVVDETTGRLGPTIAGLSGVEIPASNDPDTPPPFLYSVTEKIFIAAGVSVTRNYSLAVPYDTPINPVTGRKEIDLADVVPLDAPPEIGYVLAASHFSDPTAHAVEIAARVGDHAAAADPHPVYLTAAEGDALYTPLGTGGPPTGAAGGVLSGSYPNPGFAVDMATQAELDNAVALLLPASQKGAASGVAPLGADSKVPAANLPAGSATPDATTAAKGVVQLAGDLAGTAAAPTVPGLAGKVDSTDTRLSDSRTPTDASVTTAKIADASVTSVKIAGSSVGTTKLTDAAVTDAKVSGTAAIAESKLSLASDAAAATASRRTLGTGAAQAAAGNDSRLSDARTPTDASVTDAKVAAGAAIAPAKVAGTAVVQARSVISGTGLTGGGDLSVDRTLAVAYGTTAGTAAQGNDSRLTGIAGAPGLFGDGSDGAYVLDGTTAAGPGMTKSASNYTMTRDIYATTMLVTGAAFLNTAGFRVFCRVSLQVDSASTVRNSGSGATSSAGATGQPAGSAGGSSSGGAGGTGAVGGAVAAATAALGGAGAAGGTATNAGGAGGAASNAPTNGAPRNITQAVGLTTGGGGSALFTGGTGGGGGGAPAGSTGGGGGAGGGIVAIYAASIVNNGTISVRGGNGAQGTGANAGGGGGGGGGALVLVFQSLSGTGTTSTGGGTGGAGLGTGAAATAAAAGTVFSLQMAA